MQHGPLSFGQLIQTGHGSFDLFMPFKLVDGAHVTLLCCLIGIFDRFDCGSGTATVLISVQVESDSQNPRPEAQIADLIAMPDGAQHRLLGQILGDVPVTAQSQREPEHGWKQIGKLLVFHREKPTRIAPESTPL